jgi:predicted Zn-dependent protease
MKKILIFMAAAAVVAMMAVSCGVVSFTGRKQLAFFPDSEIMALSEKSYVELMKGEKVSSNAADAKLVKEVGGRMVSALREYMKSSGQSSTLSGLVWEFVLLESPQVNAFCMPSGKIVFYEGILEYADTPDYIAVVMGHEMAHAIARHGNERISQQIAVNLLGNVAGSIIGKKKGDMAQSLFDIGFGIGTKAGVMLPYSRKHEYEADKIGIYLMDIAGYDVNAAPQFWERMLEGRTAGESDFFSTHPSDAKRIAALKEAIKTRPNFK